MSLVLVKEDTPEERAWHLRLHQDSGINRGFHALAHVAQLVGASSCTWKDRGFEFWSGTSLGCRFGPWSRHVQEATQLMFLSHIDVSLSLSSIIISSGKD